MNSKKIKIILGIVVMSLILIAGVNVLKKGAASGPSKVSSEQKKEIWYCPMHVTYHSDRPGSCPICHMDLVKLDSAEPEAMDMGDADQKKNKRMTMQEALHLKPGEACLFHQCKHGFCNIKLTEEIIRSGKCPHCGEELGIILKEAMPEGYSSVRLDENKERLIGIKTEPAAKRLLEKTVRAVGTIAKDPELYQAEAEYLQAIQAVEKAKAGNIPEIVASSEKLLESTRIRLTSMGLSAELIQEIESRKEADKSLLYAQPNQPVWVYARIYEYEIPLVKVGSEAVIKISALAGSESVMKGKLLAMDPSVDPMTRTTRVRIRIDSAEGVLRPDMYVDVEIKTNLGEVLAVRKDAIFDTGTRQIVFIQTPAGTLEPREVALGARTEDWVEVRSGLSDGDPVVVSGNFLIDSESRLKAALQNIGSEGGHSHGS